MIYDVAVLGAGLFGSATAKYVSEDVEFSVLIGPSESAKHSTDIFGAWFDEGRIAELADSTDPWYTVGKAETLFWINPDTFFCSRNRLYRGIILFQPNTRSEDFVRLNKNLESNCSKKTDF